MSFHKSLTEISHRVGDGDLDGRWGIKQEKGKINLGEWALVVDTEGLEAGGHWSPWKEESRWKSR